MANTIPLQDLAPLQTTITTQFNSLKHECETIYFPAEPPPHELSPISMIEVSKPANFQLTDLLDESYGDEWRPALDGLLPTEVTTALRDYGMRVDSVFQTFSNSIGEIERSVQQTLAAKNLPFCLEDAGGGLPDELWAKMQDVNSRGGSTAMSNSMDALLQYDSICGSLIDECSSMLEEEENGDEEGRKKHGGNWRRKESAALSADKRSSLEAYKKKLADARGANENLRARDRGLRMEVSEIVNRTKEQIEVEGGSKILGCVVLCD